MDNGYHLVFELKDVAIKVSVYNDKSNGIYTFERNSATGKSRLCKLLKEYGAIGLPVDGYDYDNYRLGTNLDTIKSRDIKLLVIDRYDMYNGELEEDIVEISKNCIVLIDCKTIPKIDEYIEFKSILMDDDKIVIT